MKNNYTQRVKEMHTKFGISNPGLYPNALTKEEYLFRIGAMIEEVIEYAEAVFDLQGIITPDQVRSEFLHLFNQVPLHDVINSPKRLEAQLDALVDLNVFTLGTSERQAFPHDQAFNIVMNANMAKELAADANESKRGFKADLVKPEGWQAPNLLPLVQKPKGIIVIEGPDCSGKTTLAKHLINRYDAHYIHCTWSPEIDEELDTYFENVLSEARSISQDKLVIIDRMWLSELVYSKVFRDPNKWSDLCSIMRDSLSKLKAINVLCLPANKDKMVDAFENSDKEELYTTHMTSIYEEYEKHMKTNSRFFLYDRFVEPNPSAFMLAIEHTLYTREKQKC